MFTLLNVLHQHQRSVGLTLIAGLVIFMSFSVARSVSFFLDDAFITQSVNQPPTRTAINPDRNTLQLRRLNLFGEVARATSPILQEAPETRLNLELQGIFISEDPAASTAIIAEKNKPGKLFHVGDKLPGNAYLHAVRVDHILLRRGSRLEKLMFLLAKVTFESGDTAKPAKLYQNKSSEQPLNKLLAGPDNPPSEDSSLRGYLEQNKRRLQSNPDQLLREIGMSPVSKESANGYKVGSGSNSGALTQAGLQSGDVVISVNGIAVGVAMNDARLIDQAMAAGRVRVEVQRGGRRFFLTIPIP